MYYLIALDGTGVLTFDKPHCAHCLKAKIHGKTRYYHNVLAAKLVTANGLALTIGFEFIDNREQDESHKEKTEEERKQDCELKAFYRLAPRLKSYFSQLNTCLLFDSLYAAKGVFDICKTYNWKFITVFKKGSMPAVYKEYQCLKELSMPIPIEYNRNKTQQLYHWVNAIDYESHKLNVLECIQPKKKKGKRFLWLTNLVVTKNNFSELANQGGRLRWKIENEGFNIQKNGGYAMEHAYSMNHIGMMNFYALLQIGHIINQLLEKGSLLGKELIDAMGGLFKVAQRMLESLRCEPTTEEEYSRLFQQQFQIRLDSS